MNTPLNTALCSRLGIRYPIFGFSHSVDVTVALANAGCFPIYGATRDMPDEMPGSRKAMNSRWRG